MLLLSMAVLAVLQVVLMAEVVPVGTQLMCGLCLLGKELMTVKPRTNVKSLCA